MLARRTATLKRNVIAGGVPSLLEAIDKAQPWEPPRESRRAPATAAVGDYETRPVSAFPGPGVVIEDEGSITNSGCAMPRSSARPAAVGGPRPVSRTGATPRAAKRRGPSDSGAARAPGRPAKRAAR